MDSSAEANGQVLNGMRPGLDWRRMLDAFPDAAAIVDDELLLLEVNAAMCAHQHARREDLIGTRLVLQTAPPIEAGEVVHGEAHLQRPDGSAADVEFTATAIASGLNVFVFRDPGSPGNAAAQELGRRVLDSSVDAYMALDSTGRVLEWNRAAHRIFGWTREEATGRLLTELTVTDDMREWVMNDMRRFVETGESPVVGHISAHTMRRKDGTEIPVELTVSAIGNGPELTFHSFVRDLTALSEARAAQLGSEASFEAVFANAPIGIAVVGLDGTFQRVNRALCRITGYGEDELTTLTFQDITHPDDLESDINEATRLLRGEITSYQMDKRYYAKEGHIIWIRLSGSLVSDADGQPLNFIAHIEDISARKRDEDLLRRQATRDSLTGVYNRSRFEEELARYQALAVRHEYQDDAAVLMIDLDGLKRVNDEIGHAAGDDYLRRVAATIKRRLRLSDVFARIGGDEFAALLPHTSATQAQALARALAHQVKADSPGSVSIGIGMMTPGQVDGVLERADQAMYEAKRNCRGSVYGP